MVSVRARVCVRVRVRDSVGGVSVEKKEESVGSQCCGVILSYLSTNVSFNKIDRDGLQTFVISFVGVYEVS